MLKLLTRISTQNTALPYFPQISGLKYGKKYNYRVMAENAAGVSDPSNTLGPMLADDTHGTFGSLFTNLEDIHHFKCCAFVITMVILFYLQLAPQWT